jgi:hypothetical protein
VVIIATDFLRRIRMARTAPYRLAAVVVVGLWIATVEAIAIPLEVCSGEKGETWFTSLIDKFWNAEPQPNSDAQYMFTVRSGFALRHICDISNDTKYLPSVYYPVGITARPIEDLKVKIGDKKVSYMRVLTEYGVDLWIPTDDLAELKEEINGYLFVDGAENVPYCAISGCSDPSSMGTSLLLTPSGPSGVGRYGVVAEVTTDEAGCAGYKFYPFELGRRITSESTFLSDCWGGFAEGRFAVKFVSRDLAAERFSYARRGGAFANFVSGHLQRQGLQFWSYKDCLVEDTYKLEGEFGLGGDYYIFSGKLKTSASR